MRLRQESGHRGQLSNFLPQKFEHTSGETLHTVNIKILNALTLAEVTLHIIEKT